MASFDTGWTYTTSMYLNVPHNIRVTGDATRTSATNVHVTGTFYLQRAGSSYNYDVCKARLSGTSSWVVVKSYGTGSYTDKTADFSYDIAVGANDASVRIQGVFAFFGISGDSQFGDAARTSETYPTIPSSPSAPSVSITDVTTSGVKFNVSVSSWGSASTSDRYFEAALMNHSGDYGSPYCYTHGTHGINAGVTENIEVSTSVHNSGSSITTIVPNTQYYYGAWCTNGYLQASTVVGTVVTKAEAATLTVDTISDNSVTISYSLPADGGAYARYIRYTLDSGSTWSTPVAQSTGSAKSGTFDITGLSPNTSYTIQSAVRTYVGDTSCETLTVRTTGTPASKVLYGSVNGKSKLVTKLYGSLNGKTKEIKKLYGSVNGKTKLVYETKPDDLLYFEAGEAGSTVKSANIADLEYSTDGETWQDYTLSDEITLANVGDKVYFKTKVAKTSGSSSIGRFVMSGSIYAYGNIMYLLSPTGEDVQMFDYCFHMLFQSCSALRKAPDLPGTKLADHCYYQIFKACTKLVDPPEVLPATTTAKSCYAAMFSACAKLTSAPRILAEEMANSACDQMFYGCSSLTTAPELPSTNINSTCYSGMFQACTSLKVPPALPATTLAQNCYMRMFYGCTAMKVSSAKGGIYQSPYRIPASGSATDPGAATRDMFTSTGGTFTGTPSLNVTYYYAE